MDTEVDHQPFAVLGHLPAAQVIMDLGNQGLWVVVVVIHYQAAGRRVEMHTAYERPGGKTTRHQVQAERAVAVGESHNGSHRVPSLPRERRPAGSAAMAVGTGSPGTVASPETNDNRSRLAEGRDPGQWPCGLPR
ncbi:MAG: hypothetical protein ACR2LJ_07220 [Acidimicrobiales bacterium]